MDFNIIKWIVRSYDGLWALSKFPKICWNFTVYYYSILLKFRSTSMYFVNFEFHFWSFQKFTTNFWSLLKLLKISKFLTWQWQKLKKSILQISKYYCQYSNFLLYYVLIKYIIKLTTISSKHRIVSGRVSHLI